MFYHLFLPTTACSAYLSAGEPMMTLWIRMPCDTSGKDGSLNFNSAMMLKKKKKTQKHLVFNTMLQRWSDETELSHTEEIFWFWNIYLGVRVNIITPMYRRFVSDSRNQEPWKRSTQKGWKEGSAGGDRKWVWHVSSQFWFVLTLLFCRLIQKSSQAIRWNSKGDPCGDLHCVYTNHFTILIRRGTHPNKERYEIRLRVLSMFSHKKKNTAVLLILMCLLVVKEQLLNSDQKKTKLLLVYHQLIQTAPARKSNCKMWLLN